MRRLTLMTVLASLAWTTARADNFCTACRSNWHQWRGPLANGVAPNGDPPIHWDEETNIQWAVDVPGEGNSTPVVWGDQVFVATAVKTDRAVASLAPPVAEPPGGYKTERPLNYYRFVLMCLDRRTGRVLWERTANEELPHEGHHPTHGYASGSPTTDGRHVYVSFGSRGTYCYDVEGNLRWGRDLGDMITRVGWGEASTPALHGDRLVVNWDHEGDSFLVVLDAATGETLWKVDRDEITSWSTPLVVEHEGVTQVVINATRRATGYDLATGKILWECGGQTVNVVPSPVAADGVVYCASGFRGNALVAVPLGATGDLTDTDRPLWRRDRGTPYVPSPLLYGDRLYFTRSNSGVLSCLDAKSGDPYMEGVRLPGVSGIYASPAGAAGRVYFVARDGTTLVIKDGPKLEILATNRLDHPIDASPAIVGKQMFLRGKTRLYCIAAD